MKKLIKITAVLLSIVLLLVLSVNVSADDLSNAYDTTNTGDGSVIDKITPVII